jgi:hypothetical protein
LAIHAIKAVPILNAALAINAGKYRGLSVACHRKGVQMKLTFMVVVTIDIAAAFFSFVCPQTLPHQPRMRLFTAYVPTAKMTIET